MPYQFDEAPPPVPAADSDDAAEMAAWDRYHAARTRFEGATTARKLAYQVADDAYAAEEAAARELRQAYDAVDL